MAEYQDDKNSKTSIGKIMTDIKGALTRIEDGLNIGLVGLYGGIPNKDYADSTIKQALADCQAIRDAVPKYLNGAVNAAIEGEKTPHLPRATLTTSGIILQQITED